ncbi:VOC family protein [Iodobacter sp. LRB]|uniref:VOC family protein n=1 Tax=unclassified Iodobacter TaxID=235634 RepID=UPI000C0D8C40|nr:VOC family protein [Iodobacter sp. BJB302]PHV00342.1 glyoxalase [Iodobacter sp. BJB302]
MKAIPHGYHTATPYLIVNNAVSAIEFYKSAFNATEVMHLADPSGKIAHAEVKIGDSSIMLADEHPEMGYVSPAALGNSPVSIMLYVENVDAAFEQAIKHGAVELRAVSDQFYGDRIGTLKDPFGHIWSLATHIEDVSPDEINKRFAAFFTQ